MLVFWMAHPIAASTRAGVMDNVARAKRWLPWLFLAFPDRVTIAPYLPDLEVLPLDDSRPDDRDLSLRRCAAVARRCDGAFLVGGRISDGMRLDIAEIPRHMHYDFTPLGAEPPAAERAGTFGRMFSAAATVADSIRRGPRK